MQVIEVKDGKAVVQPKRTAKTAATKEKEGDAAPAEAEGKKAAGDKPAAEVPAATCAEGSGAAPGLNMPSHPIPLETTSIPIRGFRISFESD